MIASRGHREHSTIQRRWSIGLIVLAMLALPSQAGAEHATTLPDDECREPRRLLGGCRALELTGIYAVEWGFNGRPKDVLSCRGAWSCRLAGGTLAISFPFRERWSAVVELLAARVAQEEPAFLGGLSMLVRRRVAERGRTTFFVEGGAGGSDSTTPVPERGTHFNYLLHAGGGLSRPIGRRVDFIVDLRLLHISNNSLNGPDHNPDIEALGGHTGILVWF